MGKFIGYTVGLECWIDGLGIKSVKIEYSEADGGVHLRAVSGHNLGSFGRKYSKTISKDEFDSRPHDAYNDTAEAIWALDVVGLAPACIDA